VGRRGARGIIRIDPNGSGTTVFPFDFGGLLTVVVGPDGAVWGVIDHEVLRIDPATNAVERFVFEEHISLFAAGPDGLLWMITGSGHDQSLVRLDTAGQIVSTNPLSVTLTSDHPFVAAGGAMWSVGGDGLLRITASGATESFPLPLPPSPFWLLPAGDFLWVATDPSSATDVHEVARVSTAGAVLDTYPAPVETIIGATVDAQGNLIVVEELTQRLVRLAPNGHVTLIANLLESTLCLGGAPEPIAVAPDGRIAIGQWGMSGPAGDPADPCRTHPAAVSRVVIFSPAHLHEIPTLDPAALAALVVLITAIAAHRLFR
jgi:streptogramin lyase